MDPDSERYVRLLLLKKHGYPLWDPRPSADAGNIAHATDGIQLGDVGIMQSDGSFLFLFNVRDMEKTLILRSQNERPIFNPPQETIASEQGSRLKYRSSIGIAQPLTVGARVGASRDHEREEGAMLRLPRGAIRANLVNDHQVCKAVTKNAFAWKDHISENIGCSLPADSLYIITGHDKSSSWTAETWTRKYRENHLELAATVPQIVDADLSVSQMMERPEHRATRSSDPNSPTTPRNQSNFLRGYKLTFSRVLKFEMSTVRELRSQSFQGTPQGRLMGRKSTKRLGDSTGTSSGSRSLSSAEAEQEVEYVEISDMSPQTYFHPLLMINTHILDLLERAGFEVPFIITHDDIWMSVIDENAPFPEADDLLERVCSRYTAVLKPGQFSLLLDSSSMLSHSRLHRRVEFNGLNISVAEDDIDVDDLLCMSSVHHEQDRVTTPKIPAENTLKMSHQVQPGVDSPYLPIQEAQVYTFLPHNVLQQSQTFYAKSAGGLDPSKHFRTDLQHEDEAGLDDHDLQTKQKNQIKSGACQRCKNLKVRCEFKTDTDPCKRCLNGGHECVIPGRKKRGAPPKREHLLNEIRQQAEEINRQAEEIKKLTSQLKESNKNVSSRPLISASDSASLSPTVLSSSSTRAWSASASTINPETNKVVEDWLSKARDSLAEFGGFIGAGLPQSFVVEEDPEALDSDDDWTDAASSPDARDEEYGIDIVSDEEQHVESSASLAHQQSFHPKKKDSSSEKPVTVPSEAVPFGLMAGLSLRTRKRSSAPEVDIQSDAGKAFGVANEDFFRSSPAPDPRRSRIDAISSEAPHIITRGIITTQEAERLFSIYYDSMNASLSLLDPVLYTAQNTYRRSSFMFTVICALASRFYTERPNLHTELMRHARRAAGTALVSGSKNIEMCIGFILLSLFPVPTKQWEDQRSWLYLGLAIRIAVDLNLHLPNTAKPQNEAHAREQLNRTRIWLNCHNLDRSTGSQFGKAPIISNMDYTANHTEDWWQRSEYNMKHFDIHICCYNEELRAMARFIAKTYSNPNHPTGLNKDASLEELAIQTDEELQQLARKWFAIIDKTDMTDEQNAFRTGLLRLAFPYARLVALSYGFQYGKHSLEEQNPFFMRCLAAASDVVNRVVNDLSKYKTFLTRGPDDQRVFLTFAAAFLVKLLQPKFASYLSPEKRVEMVELVRASIDHLNDIAFDEHHGPRLYARFLEGLLESVETMNVQHKSSPETRPTYALENYDMNHDLATQATSPSSHYTPLTFNQFASPGGDPQAPYSAQQTSLNMSDYFYPPLPYDKEVMASMQALADPAWQDMASLPGLNMVAQFQNRQPMPDVGRQWT